MKIGILIKRYNELSNWEFRIIQEIINDPRLELLLLIQDGRGSSENHKTIKSKIYRLLKSNNILGKSIFKFQRTIERNFFFKEKFTVDKESIIRDLDKIPTVKVKPKKKGFLDVFDKNDIEEIEKQKLDIILRHEFNIIRGNLLNASKYGIWSFHHADNAINRGGPPGFWEIVYGHASVGVTLQQLTPELDGGLVIDKAFFNRHWSFVKTNDLILEASVSLLLKNIGKLISGNYSATKSLVYSNPLYKSPNFFYAIKYIYSFYYNLTKKIFERLGYKLLDIRYSCWSIFIGKGDFLNSTLFKLNPVKLPKNEFWADPFIFSYQGDNYVFFENYNYKIKKGKLSCGRIENKELTEIRDVLEQDYHLSYPYVFIENNEIYLMPETSSNNRLEIYKCVEFPNNWELFSTAFDGEKVFDSFFFNDEHKQKWLFTNKNLANELYIYKVDSLKLCKIIPHKQNPVIIDSRNARNAGIIFEYENEKYRPSQANIDGVYGRALNINRIKKLSLEEYVEETIVTVKPNFYKGLISVHHLHQTNDMFVIDAAFKKVTTHNKLLKRTR